MFLQLGLLSFEHSCDWVGYSMINWVKGKSIRVHNLSWHYDFGHGCLCKRCYSAMLWFGKKFGWFLQIISPLIKAVKQLMYTYHISPHYVILKQHKNEIFDFFAISLLVTIKATKFIHFRHNIEHNYSHGLSCFQFWNKWHEKILWN